MTQNDLQVKKNRAVLVGLWAHRLSVEENATEETVEELADLLETAGGECVGTVLQSKDSPDPRTFIGEGKVAEVRELVRAMDADMVIFDNSLSPSQQRVLSEELKVAVMDRSALILDIFAQRARTREGRLQVELAQYKYLLPRLLGMWTHLERQEGAIGTRGPGETQLETDRRHIHRKIAKLEDELRDVRRVRATQRERRIKNEVPVVAIVGYTNAGKSTLLKILAGIIPIDSGKRIPGTTTRIGYFSQARTENLNPENTVLEEIMKCNAEIREEEARSILGSFLFRRLDVEKRVSVLSGGEKSRLSLVKFLVDPPNLLLMDEPTTHLDLLSVEALVQALKHYEGTLVFISHDVHFIRSLAEKTLHVNRGTITTYAGGYDYYLEKSGILDDEKGGITAE